MLSLDDVTVVDRDNPHRLAVDGVSLDVRAGEIVCLYGLMGAGRTELLEALAGRHPIRSGSVTLNGLAITSQTIADRIRLGLALVPEDRQRDGLVQTMTVGENLSLAGLRAFVRGMFVAGGSERRAVDRSIRDVRVKTAGPSAPIITLSGGNQQKVVVGKVLMTEPKAILLDEPTRGVDVGARSEIFALMLRRGRAGARRALRHVGGQRGAQVRPPGDRDVQGPLGRGVRPGDGDQGRGDDRLGRGRQRRGPSRQQGSRRQRRPT